MTYVCWPVASVCHIIHFIFYYDLNCNSQHIVYNINNLKSLFIYNIIIMTLEIKLFKN